MDPREFKFLMGIIAGSCIYAALWLRFGDPAYWVLDWLDRWLHQ